MMIVIIMIKMIIIKMIIIIIITGKHLEGEVEQKTVFVLFGQLIDELAPRGMPDDVIDPRGRGL